MTALLVGGWAGVQVAGSRCTQQPEPLQAEVPAPRSIMGQVFRALRRTLPASLDEKRFSDPTNRSEIGHELGILARHAEQLERHGVHAEEGFAFLARALARDARQAEQRYSAGHYSEARLLLHDITATCASCHTRLPDPEDAALSSRLMEDAAFAALELPDRATVAMATRQFDQALEAHEAMLTSPDLDVPPLALQRSLEDYLEVCIRVKGDFERPARVLAAFAEREDLRPAIREVVEQWVEDLRELGAREPIVGLDAARALVQEAEAAANPMQERAQRVRYVAASGALHRLVSVLDPRGPRAAEVYYWLGVIELRIGRSFWLSQTEPYLEAAIRLAPGHPRAKQAYEMLEDHVVLGYTGSSGEKVPPDIRRWLDELHRLVAAARPEDA